MQLPPTLVVRHDNLVSRILNWRVVDPQPKFNTIVESIFSNEGNRVTYRNISPSPTELAVHDLTHFTETARNHADTSIVPDGFDDFSTPPPPNVYMMSNVSGSSSAQPHKKHKLDSASHAVKYDTPDTRGRIEETMISKGKQPLINPDINHPHKYGEKQHTTSHHEQSHNNQVQSTHSKSTSNQDQTHNIQVQIPQSKSTEDDSSFSQKEYSLLRKEIDNLKESGKNFLINYV